MSKINKDNLAYLGLDFQYRLIKQIIIDTKYGESIMDIINPNYFEDTQLRIIVATLKSAYEKYDTIPDLNSLKARMLDSITDEIDRGLVIGQLRRIEEADLNDTFYIQETGLKFCKRQELKKATKKIENIITNGGIEEYDECENILKKALEVGNSDNNTFDVTDNIESVLSEDYRNPIPTGIEGLDDIMEGGLAKTELAIILAAWGVGKTTMITKMANFAKSMGYNVMQIFFEDTVKVIQRKHIACTTKIPLNELSLRKNEALEKFKSFSESKGVLKLVKLRSDNTTIPKIKQMIRKQISQGFKPDIIFVDYIDCIAPSKRFEDINEGQGSVMREFEGMLEELDIAGWTATQGNRSSIKADIVEGDQMGGSIKKAQIGHFLVSIAKTLEQRESGHANMAILKSRFGKSGVIYEDIVFDNSTVQIDMSNDNSNYNKNEEDNTHTGQERINAIMNAIEQRKSVINNQN